MNIQPTSIVLTFACGKMLIFGILLLCLFFVGLGLCQQGTLTNVALLNNGGNCYTPIPLSNTASCNRLIDGRLQGGDDYKWHYSGTNIIQNYLQFQFDKKYLINRVVVYHASDSGNRNIKVVRLTFENGYSTPFILENKVQGRGKTDSVDLEIPVPQSSYMNMTITELYNADQEYTALYEVEVLGVPLTTINPSLTTAGDTTTVFPETTVEDTSPTFTTVATERTTHIIQTSPTSPTTISSVSTSTSTTVSTSTKSTATSSTALSTYTTSTTTKANVMVPGEEKSSITMIPSSTISIIDTTTEELGSGVLSDSKSETPSVETIVGVVMAILVIAAVLLVVGLIFLRRRRQKKKIDKQSTDGNVYVNMRTIENAPKSDPGIAMSPPASKSLEDDGKSYSSPEISPKSSIQDLKLVDGEAEYANRQQLPVNSNAIKLDNLASAVDGMLQKASIFQEEFKSIPAGKQHATTFADRSTLQPKNRFKNIKPYDHSRVSLVQKESVDSVYINANFISAFKRPKYYIAAQGPNNDTVTDFWRMIWEQRVSVIVMVTNCIEGGKDKCRQYWPDGEKGAHQSSGDFDVVLDKNTLIADYTVRDFKLSQNDESRNVRQYHYTSWPDEGVPTSCSALISFVNRIREFTEDKDPPIVVHCSAGVGRTGTFIVVNYSIDMAREEGIVDIKKVVHRLREDRINMVQTLSQYKFLYALMLECLYCGEVTIPCQGASEKIQQIFIKEDGMDSPAEKQWIVLEVLKPKKYDEECLAGKDNDNIEKNRKQTILPHDNHRPYLRRRPDYTSNYINAVFVDGYKQKNKFLLTQHPLENTIVDLWRTVSDFNVSTIVMLNGYEENADAYWPKDEFSEALQYGDFLEVTFKRVDKQVDFTITELDLSEDKEKANVVTHIHVKNWSEDSKPKLSILPALYNTVSQAQMTDEDSRIMIHSLNGGGNTGVYCALHQIFDKIKEEQEIDIFNAVKNTRMPRPDSIPDLETYKYLHEASVQFIEEFSTYANFR